MAESPPPPVPRDAASVMLLRDDPLRVLMVVRSTTLQSFASQLVFPGGVVDETDRVAGDLEATLRRTAIRETAEEVGILIPTPSALVPFARWITPPEQPRRWDARFFLTAAPDDQEPEPDGEEIVGARWVEPAEIVARLDRDERLPIPVPTLANLRRLAASRDLASAIAAAAAEPGFALRPFPLDLVRRFGDPPPAG